MARTAWLPRMVARWLAISVMLGGIVGAVFSARGDGTRGEFAIVLGISVLYSATTGLPAMLVLRWLRPRLARRGALVRWSSHAIVMVAITLAGALVAGLALVALGATTLDTLWVGYVRGLQIPLAIALPVSVVGATLARLRARIVTAEASLHAKEHEHQRALVLATEARLASLESRVRPHFLFNALNSAIALIPDDPARAEQVLERLAALLRASLDRAASTVTLGDELQVVRDYLEIERARFGDRLRYEIDVPDELRGARIPSFAVQTVVENSVKYAVSPRRAGARIWVRGRRDAGRLRLEVLDDGPGFSGAIWRAGHGLDALRTRLDALYGPDARLVAPIERAAGAGAAVAIELPEAAA